MNAEIKTSENLNLRKWQIVALGLGFAGLIASFFGFFFYPPIFFRAYLLAFVFWTGLALGNFGVLLIQFVTGGAWGLILKRALFAASKTLPLLGLLFIPLILGLQDLYPWTSEAELAADETLRHKAVFLNESFFLVRQAVYFIVWIGGVLLLNRWENKRRETNETVYDKRIYYGCAAGLFFLAVTVSLWLIDLVMSLEPQWYSTIYPLIWITGQLLGAFALAIPATLYFAAPLPQVLNEKRMRDLGNLLLAFVMLWAYCSFSQYLLIWSGNLREEIPWYLERISGVWGTIAIVLIVLHFFVPFLLLLIRAVKQSRRFLGAISIFLLLMRYADAFWLIKPAFKNSVPVFGALDAAATIGVGGIWLAAFLWLYEREKIFIEER